MRERLARSGRRLLHALVARRNVAPADWAGAEDRGPVATVSAVGRAVVTRPAVTAAAVAALPAARTWGAGRETFWALVPVEAAADAQRALHAALLEP